MVVGVDQTGQDDVSIQIEHFVGSIGEFIRWAHLLDKAIPNKKTTVGYLPAMVIHGN
jgi:hypothetical protein